MRQPRRRVTIRDRSGAPAAFWMLHFRSSRVDAEQLEVYYAWSEGTRWMAPEQPRFSCAGYRFLYKMQLAALAAPRGGSDQPGPCRQFLERFLPAAASCLVDATGGR